MTSPSVLASGVSTGGTGSTATQPSVGATKPTGATSTSHWLIARLLMVFGTGRASVSTPPTNWTMALGNDFGTTGRDEIWVKWVENSEVGSTPTYTWTFDSNRVADVGILAISGAHTTTPILVSNWSLATTTAATIAAPDVDTTPKLDTLILRYYYAAANATWSAITNWPENFDIVAGPSGTWVSQSSVSAAQASAGATGTLTGTHSGTSSTQRTAYTIAIQPAVPSLLIPTQTPQRVLSLR